MNDLTFADESSMLDWAAAHLYSAVLSDACDAAGFRDRNLAKFQGAVLSERNGFLRSAWMISPAMETAISDGLTAPMSRPIGA